MQSRVDELATMLSWPIGADRSPLLTAAEARSRAETMSTEISALRFDLRLFAWKNMTPAGQLHPRPAYLLD